MAHDQPSSLYLHAFPAMLVQVIMYDEPTAGLDPVASTVVEDLIRSMQSTRAKSQSNGGANSSPKGAMLPSTGIASYIVVTHQHSTIRRAVDRIIFLHEVCGFVESHLPQLHEAWQGGCNAARCCKVKQAPFTELFWDACLCAGKTQQGLVRCQQDHHIIACTRIFCKRLYFTVPGGRCKRSCCPDYVCRARLSGRAPQRNLIPPASPLFASLRKALWMAQSNIPEVAL